MDRVALPNLVHHVLESYALPAQLSCVTSNFCFHSCIHPIKHETLDITISQSDYRQW